MCFAGHWTKAMWLKGSGTCVAQAAVNQVYVHCSSQLISGFVFEVLVMSLCCPLRRVAVLCLCFVLQNSPVIADHFSVCHSNGFAAPQSAPPVPPSPVALQW